MLEAVTSEKNNDNTREDDNTPRAYDVIQDSVFLDAYESIRIPCNVEYGTVPYAVEYREKERERERARSQHSL